jgi:sporulation protein YlmC with PRC-barrel domain
MRKGTLLIGLLMIFSFAYIVSALNNYYDPVSNVATGWDDGAGVTFAEIDDGIREPSAPDSATNVQSRVNDGLTSEFAFAPVIESSVNNMTLWVYVDNGANAEFTFELQQSGVTRCSTLVSPSINGWLSCVWNSPSGDFSTITAELGICNKNGGGPPTNCRVDSVYLDVDYDLTAVDNEYPLFGNYLVNPVNNSAYISGGSYEFNSSIASTNGSAGIEFEGTNYTATNLSDIFRAVVSNLGAGTYSYYWWAFGNGTDENYNTSVVRSYTIARASSEVNLTFNGTEGNISILQGDSILLNGTLITGEGSIELYNDGALINFGSGEVSNFTTFNGLGLHNITVIYVQSQNYSESSETYWVNVSAVLDTINPSVSILVPLNVSYTAVRTELNYTVNDTNLDSCWYSLDLGITNVSVTCGANVSGLDSGEGSSVWVVYVNDTSGNVNESSVTFFVDSLIPSLDGLTEDPADGVVYSAGARYEFNSTASDTNLQSVVIEFSGTNYTMSDSGGGVYNFTILDLGAGTYNYYWFANDSVGNRNVSVLQSYTIAKASQTALLNLNESSPITYGVSLNVTCNGELFRDDVDVSSEISYGVLLGVGTYNYSCKLYANQNYTYDEDNSTFVVSQAVGNISLLLNGLEGNQTSVYGTNSNSSASTLYGSLTLYRDGNVIDSENHLNVTLGVGDYNYTVNSSGDQNHSSASLTRWVHITQVSSVCNLTVFPSESLTYPSLVNVSGSCDNPEVSYNLFRDNVNVNSENGLDVLLGVGTYNYVLNISETQNYSFSENTTSVTVSQETGEVATYIGGLRADDTIEIGVSIWLNGSLISGEFGSINLTQDGVQLNYSDTGDVGFLQTFNSLGSFVINTSYSGNTNYTSDGEAWTVTTLDTEPPYFTLIPSDSVLTYGNGLGVDFDATDGFVLDSYAINWSDTFAINESGYLRNSSGMAAGTYSINVTINDSSDNLNSTIYSVIVNRASSSCSIGYDGPAMYPNSINVSVNCDNPELSYELFRDDVDVTSENSLDVVLGAGSYEYVVNVSQTQNYSNASAFLTATVNLGIPSGSLSGTSPKTYGTVWDVQGSESNTGDSDLVYRLYRENVEVSNPDMDVLGAGTYNYVYNTSGGMNWSANFSLDSFSLTVDVNSSYVLSLSLLPSASESFGVETNVTGSGCPSQLSCILYRDNVNIGNSEVAIMGAGIYNYTFNTTGNANYSFRDVSEMLMITQVGSEVNLTFNGTEGNISILQGDSILLNGTLITGEGSIELYNDGALINFGSGEVSNFTTFNLIGEFNISVIYPNTQNYSESSETYWVNVNSVLDTINPSVSILVPLNVSYTAVRTELNYTAGDDAGLDSCWYSLDLGITNVSVTCGANVSGLDSGEGSSVWVVYVNDTSGNVNESSVTFFVDSIAPTVLIVSPLNTSYNNATIPVNLSSDGNNVWFYYGSVNETYSSEVFRTFGQGSTTVIAYANDSIGNFNFSSVTFFVDSLAPLIDYGFGSEVNGSIFARNWIYVNVSVNESNEEVIVFSLWNGSGILNRSEYSDGTREINWTGLVDGTYYYNVSVNDSLGNENTTESRTIILDGSVPTLSIVSPTAVVYSNSLILVNISSNGQSVWFFNGTGNESYMGEVYRKYGDGSHTFIAYANNSAGIKASSSVLFSINTMSLSCEAGGNYQEGALVLIQGELSNESGAMSGESVNVSVLKIGVVNVSEVLTTASDGGYETSVSGLNPGSYILNTNVSVNGINQSCFDSFNIGGSAGFVLDKIGTVNNVYNNEITYKITLRLTNNGGANALSSNVSDSDGGVFVFGTVNASTSSEVSYLLNLTRENVTSYYYSDFATAFGLDSFDGSLVSVNSLALNLTVPPVSIGRHIVITKNVIFVSEASLNVTYNVSVVLLNSGDEDLKDISFVDSDISGSALFSNLSKGGSVGYESLVVIAKAASNTVHQFALGSATVSAETFLSNRPSVSVSGYGGPADAIVYAPASVVGGGTLHGTIEVVNVNKDIGQDFTADYWITNDAESVNYSSGQQTVFVGADSSTNISVSLSAPSNAGDYRLRALVSWVAGIASSFDSFIVSGGGNETGKEGDSASGGGAGGVGVKVEDEGVVVNEGGDVIIRVERCEAPYIQSGVGCCLDENGNSVCDESEVEEGPESERVEPERGITGFFVNLPERVSEYRYFFLGGLVIITFFYLLYRLINYLRKKSRSLSKLKQLRGALVYTTSGIELGRVREVYVIENKVDSIAIKLRKRSRRIGKIADGIRRVGGRLRKSIERGVVKVERKIAVRKRKNERGSGVVSKHKGIIVKYKFVEGVRDIVIVDERVLEKL